MQRLEGRLREAVDMLPLPLFILDGEGRCVFANQPMLSLLGYRLGAADPPRRNDFWPDFERMVPFPLKTGRHEPYTCKTDFRRVDRETVFVQVVGSAIGLGNESVWRVSAGFSKEERLENFHAQRLETLGMLASGIAHDFNNLLAGVVGHVTFLKTILGKEGAHVESLSAIADGAKKGAALTQQILSFSRLDGQQPKELDVTTLVRDTCVLLRGALPSSCQLHVHLPETTLMILAGEGKLAQVLANLVVNARDAVGNRGEIVVAVDGPLAASSVERFFDGRELSSSSYVTLTVKDNGSGMSDEVLRRAFEPYFSTKKEKGTGLGLATVSAIVREYGGVVRISSREQQGTTVTVILPLLDREPVAERTEAQSVSATIEELPRGSERILIIDDEYPVRNVLSLSLEHLGYRVVAAASGSEGIEIYRTAMVNDPFALVLLDMVMPQLPGEEVYKRIRALDPMAAVMIITGFAAKESVQTILHHGGKGILAKPFTIQELAQGIRRCLSHG